MPRRTIVPSATVSASIRCAVLAAAVLVPTLARADVEWHRDLDTAHAAARISRRPVLAVFVASWGADTFETTCLASAEAAAVLATCFEPVRIDIDERPELTRAARVTHVPTACVLAADDSPLASFEMPDSPAAFVTAAILAAQRAAEAESGSLALAEGQAPHPAAAATPPAADAFGSAPDSATGAQLQPRGSMARVTAKVRDLSAFARSQPLPPATMRPVAMAQASRPVTGPGPASAPLTWPAEQATASPTTAASASTIEPAALTPATVAPWLDAPPAQPARPAAVANASAASAPAPLPATAPPAPPAPPQPTGLIAALQKPFGLGPQTAEPPTLPPALPRGPFAGPAQPAAAVEPQGSMPLGLEGYCPVTLVDRGSWVEGRAQWGARHRGRTYLFAGEQEQQAFLANPDRYAPALSGDDPVLALDRGSSTPGQRRYGVTYQSRMYLFATPETRQAFASDPGRYATRIAVAERSPADAGATRTY